MAGISVRFDTKVYDGSEVITLYYRANGVFGCKFFTETYNPRTNEVRSAMSNMMRFVYCLMGRVAENTERFYRKH
jgi:hypothetical protein